MLSLVMLNWKRHLKLKYRAGKYLQFPIVKEVIIWNNSSVKINIQHSKAIVINPPVDIGMPSRWLAALHSTTDCLLFVDDDAFIPMENIQLLYNHWLEDDTILHGFWGRVPKPDNTYAIFVECKEAEVDIVGCRASMSHKNYVYYMLQHMLTENITQDIKQNYHEDIYFSYLVQSIVKKNNRVHKPIIDNEVDREDAHAICLRPEHARERTLIMHRGQQLL